MVPHAGSASTQEAKAGRVRVQASLSYKARPRVLPWEHHKQQQWRLSQEDGKLEASLGNTGKLHMCSTHSKPGKPLLYRY